LLFFAFKNVKCNLIVETEMFIYEASNFYKDLIVGLTRMKRAVPSVVAKSIMTKVPQNLSFWLCTNENLRSLSDVSDALEKASDEVFRYHVNRDKNDFELWIRDVVRDKDLAREIARVKTRETLIRKISERIDELRKTVKRVESRKKKTKPKKKSIRKIHRTAHKRRK
jgi:hypothetical protein